MPGITIVVSLILFVCFLAMTFACNSCSNSTQRIEKQLEEIKKQLKELNAKFKHIEVE